MNESAEADNGASRASAFTDGNDNILQIHEIADLKLNPLLVSLAGCRSAGGVVSAGEGVKGLAQAFIYAGANCVLASMLDVPDRLTRDFINDFYTYVARGIRLDESLRLAQLKAKNSKGKISSPGIWSCFVLIGNSEAAFVPLGQREMKDQPAMLYVVIYIAIGVIILLLIFRLLAW